MKSNMDISEIFCEICFQMNAIWSHQLLVNIGSGNGLVP